MESPSHVGLAGLKGVSPGPSQTQLLDKSLSVKACFLACHNGCNTEAKFFKLWETEDLRTQQMKVLHSVTNRALTKEALRYGSVLNTWGKRIPRSSSYSSFSFDRTPEGEYYDHFGALREVIQEENPLRLIVLDGSAEDGNGC